MSMEISYPNIGLISLNYGVINKANEIIQEMAGNGGMKYVFEY